MITNTTPPTLSGSTTRRVVTSHDHKHNTTHTLRVYNTQGGYITWSQTQHHPHSQGLQHAGWLHHMITNTTPPTLSGSTTRRVVTSHDHKHNTTHTLRVYNTQGGYITWSQTQHHPHSQGLQHAGWLHHMIANTTPPTLSGSTTRRVVTSHDRKHNTTHTLRVYNTQGGYITWSQTQHHPHSQGLQHAGWLHHMITNTTPPTLSGSTTRRVVTSHDHKHNTTHTLRVYNTQGGYITWSQTQHHPHSQGLQHAGWLHHMITNTTPPTLSGSTTRRVVTSHDHKHNTTHTLRVYNTQGGYITWSQTQHHPHSQGLQHAGWLHHMITNTTPPTLSGSTTRRVVTSHDHKHNTTHTLRVYNTQGGYITWSQTQHHPHSQGLQHAGWLHHMITNTTPPTLSGSTTRRVVTSHDHKHNTTHTLRVYNTQGGYITWSQT